jgi:hypothetical protein
VDAVLEDADRRAKVAASGLGLAVAGTVASQRESRRRVDEVCASNVGLRLDDRDEVDGGGGNLAGEDSSRRRRWRVDEFCVAAAMKIKLMAAIRCRLCRTVQSAINEGWRRLRGDGGGDFCTIGCRRCAGAPAEITHRSCGD